MVYGIGEVGVKVIVVVFCGVLMVLGGLVGVVVIVVSVGVVLVV